jgi:hypothetical protein
MGFFFIYIDPGTSSVLVQILIGISLALGMFFRNIKQFFIQLFGKKKKPAILDDES